MYQLEMPTGILDYLVLEVPWLRLLLPTVDPRVWHVMLCSLKV